MVGFSGFTLFLLLASITCCRGQVELGMDSSSYQDEDSTFFRLKTNLKKAGQLSSQRDMAIGYFELGEFYRRAGVYSEALDQYNKASEKISSNSGDTLHILINNRIGSVYLALNNFELGKRFFEEALKGSHNLDYLKGKAVSQGLLGSCHEKQGDYLEALRYQNESLSVFEKLMDGKGIATVNENIGSIYEDLGNFDMAYGYFIKSYSHVRGMATRQEANVLNNLGDVFRKKGNYGKAIAHTEKALLVAQRIQDNHQLESASKDLSKAYALLGNYKKAHYHLMEAERYQRAILKAQNTNQLNVLQTIYDTNKKEAQIRLLKEQNKVGKAKQDLLWVALFSIVTILLILYAFIGRKRKARLKLQEYRQRTLKAELDKKAIEEKNLQREVKLKTAALSRYSLHLSQKNKILLDLSNTLKNITTRKNMDTNVKIRHLIKEIDFNLKKEHEWDEFMNFFKEIHPDFIKRLTSLSEGNLSPAEMRLGMLLRLNMTSKEIASILRVTPDSVRVARHRLRKKLPIDQKEELVNFMVEL